MKYDVIVIGAGIMGVSSALSLTERGLKTLVIDPLPLKNTKNASNDVSRVFRIYQGQDALKEHMALMAREYWNVLASHYYRREIFRSCEVLLIEPDTNEVSPLTHGISLMGRTGIGFRFPQFRAETAMVDSSGGILNATGATVAFAKASKTAGAIFIHGRGVSRVRKGRVTLDDGTVFEAGQVVVTCGSWTDRLLEKPLGIRATRQEVAFFRPEMKNAFSVDHFPIFAHLPTWFYGFPDHGTGLVKIARHVLGPEMDPDEETSEASELFVSDCREFFSNVIPDLSEATLVTSRTCRYAVREGEEFLIDRIDDRTVVATAFRGEGFKFAPVIGVLVADLVEKNEMHADFNRFRL